jgi:AraC family transcriptional regulator
MTREFQRHSGCSAGQYVRKLQAAREKLAHSDSMADIVLEMGFSNQAHFSRTFGLVTGMSPSRLSRLAPLAPDILLFL